MSLTCCFCCSGTKRKDRSRERLYSSLPGMQMSIRKKQGIMTSQPCDSDENICEDDVTGETSGCRVSDTECNEERVNRKTKCNRKISQRYSLPFFMWDKRNIVKNESEPEDTDKTETGTNRIEQLEHISVLPTSSTEFDLGYNLEVMKQKQCIALINNTLIQDGDSSGADPTGADPESLKQCSALVRAVEIAAYEIYSNRGDCSRRDSTLIKTSLNEYKISELILSSVDRADARRSGIAERCEVERNLVKLSLKYLMQHALMSV